VNEVVNGLRPGAALGVVPAGASSVFARQLGFPQDSRRAARLVAAAISARSTRTIGLGELNGRRFTFAASVGFDADTTGRVDATRRHRRSRRRPSDVRVVVLALQTLREDGFALHEQMTVSADGGPGQRASWLAVANQHPYTYFGRIPVKAAPRARFDRGLDAVVAHELRPVDLWRLAVYGLFWPAHASGSSGRIGYLHDRATLEVTCDRPLGHQLDGEYLGAVERVLIRHLPGAVEVLVPPQQRPAAGSL
jgi:diacylglycerol kinase family enzyme